MSRSSSTPMPGMPFTLIIARVIGPTWQRMGGRDALAGLIGIYVPERPCCMRAEGCVMRVRALPSLRSTQSSARPINLDGSIAEGDVMGASFGLILPNRAVVLGAVTVRDLLGLT